MPIFRVATRDDVPAIVALLTDDAITIERAGGRRIDGSAYQAAFEEIAADPRNHIVVAEVEGVVVGTLQITFIPGLGRLGGERAHIESVRVAAHLRGQGLGRRMAEWAIGWARERGCVLVQLTSDKRRTGAIRFYESLGFEATHEGLKLTLRHHEG